MKAKPEIYYALIPTILLCGLLIYQATGLETHDFANYYFGGKFLARDRFPPDIYFPYWFNREITAAGHPAIFAGFAPNTPFLAFLFIPLAMLPIAMAKLVFNSLSVALFLFSMKRLAAFYNIRAVYLLLVPPLFFLPLRNEIYFGQVYFLLFFFLAEFWLAYERKLLWKASFFLALAIMLKVFPALLLAVPLFRKETRPLFYTIGFCLLLVGLTLFFCPADTWLFYLGQVLPKASAGGIASAYVENYQSVFMFLKRLLVFEPTENPGGFFSQPLLFQAVVLAFKIFILTTGFYLTRRGRTGEAKSTSPLPAFSYWILAVILISPYGSTYTFVLMLFPFFFVATDLTVPMPKKTLLLALMLLVNDVPVGIFFRNPFPLSYLRLFALLLFFGLILSLVYKAVRWKIVSLLAGSALLAALILKDDNSPKSAYLLDSDSPLLIYDYKIGNNRLTYFFWNQDGKNSKTIALEVSQTESADLTRNEIYFFGKRIPSDSGNKRKPIIINGNTLLYLSDFDRGIGFYTLRKVGLK